MFILSESAKKKLKRQKLLRFWISSPIIRLITYKKRKSAVPTIKPNIVSAKKLEEHYLKDIIEIDGLRITPNFDVLRNTANADEWLLDVASDGSFVLLADGKLIDPYWPQGVADSEHNE